MNTILLSIIVVIAIISLYLIAYFLNQKVSIPKECKISMEDNSCASCKTKDSCIDKESIIEFYKKQKEKKNEIK